MGDTMAEGAERRKMLGERGGDSTEERDTRPRGGDRPDSKLE